ncbi:hypothetical protein [Hymenobacter psychrotolerans]|uniref:Uncharacterized protein n=1 Tax=Hymenobacter psychrotolerans DSM 18569 TaxID=1121959 RepID=A0A1M7HVG5_9BACT|nr:hypothetical protein [Hymenobacter psychrotolerans]SHM32470.1 hypothetical protein SAMN02746009_04288 [Hymenobacter psychrotolerans DSM 18569]
MGPYLAKVAAKTDLSATDLRVLRLQLLTDAAAALMVLLAATAISLYKSWGRIGKWPRATQLLCRHPGAAICLSPGWGCFSS